MAYASWSVVFGEQPSAAKWNILGTNDASFNDGTGIADGAIDPKHLETGAGSSWAMQAGTPAATGFSSKSDDTLSYVKIGKMVFCHVFINGTSNSTSFSFTLPFAAKASHQYFGIKIGNNGTVQTVLGGIVFTASSTTASARTNTLAASTDWASSNGKLMQGYFFYEAQ